MIDDLPPVVSSYKVGLYCPPYMSTPDVARATGVPGYTLRRWFERGWIVPVVDSKGSGTARIWHPSVINEVVAIRQAIDRCPHNHNETE